MSHIAGFDYDLFISYADTENVADWVKQFQDALALKLAQHFGSVDDIRISNSNNNIASNPAAVLLACISTNYASSAACVKEFEDFRLRFGGDAQKRIFIVALQDLMEFEQTIALTAFTRIEPFRFYAADTHELLPFEHREYQDQLKKLADAIAAQLKILRSTETTQESDPSESACDIYLANVAESLQTEYKRLASELDNRGITVHNRIPPPYPATEHDTAVTTALQQTKLSVHLLNEWSGSEIQDAEQTTYPNRQLELAFQQEREPLIWIPKHLNLDPQQSGSTRRLQRKQARLQQRWDALTEKLDGLTSQLDSETRYEEKSRLQKLIDADSTELDNIEQQLDELETQLKSTNEEPTNEQITRLRELRDRDWHNSGHFLQTLPNELPDLIANKLKELQIGTAPDATGSQAALLDTHTRISF